MENPPEQELLLRLVSDLDRAMKTERLFDYPNYVGKLHRTRGELLEKLGDNDGAIAAYRSALEANPKAGCRKQLERLSGAPVVLPGKPKPKPTEDRVRLDSLTMFHFRCPVCGSTPKEVGARHYLAGWWNSGIGRLDRLFAALFATTQELKGSTANSAKKFRVAADKLITALSQRPAHKPPTPSPVLLAAAPKTLVMQSECPVCERPSGLRRKDDYFTVWSEACRVQSSNLFYEVGVILLGLCSDRPAWLDDDSRQFCETIRSKAFRAGEAVGLISCPQCGRFTSCLHGGTRCDPERGICRWCLGASGANQITLEINLGAVVKEIDGLDELEHPQTFQDKEGGTPDF